MAQFNGFLCDKCDAVFPSEDRVKKTVKYDGTEVQGETTQDLCPSCAREEVTPLDLRPLRRRGATKPEATKPEAETPSPEAEQDTSEESVEDFFTQRLG